MSEYKRFGEATDALCEVILAMEDVVNSLLDDDAREQLDTKQVLEEMALRYRCDQPDTPDRGLCDDAGGE